MENGEKNESNNKVEATTINKGLITVGKTENEMILNSVYLQVLMVQLLFRLNINHK